ncbi:hypothetical protein [Halodesulfovibrio sp. MK-HDV]|uniref:hypothetical protein n=1 Tax=unclassified Halodesulfovibrio TaxID=2644657 RepID=UPI0013689FFA|nr:hypothetical protein [Halodesulfovibrio sp. MK-HDV]
MRSPRFYVILEVVMVFFYFGSVFFYLIPQGEAGQTVGVAFWKIRQKATDAFHCGVTYV